MIRGVADDFSDASSMNAVRVSNNNRVSGQTDTEIQRAGHASGVSGFSDQTDTEVVRVPGGASGVSAMSESDMVRMDGITESDTNDQTEFTRLKEGDMDMPNRMSTVDKAGPLSGDGPDIPSRDRNNTQQVRQSRDL